MSWILGFVGDGISFDQQSTLAAIHDESLLRIQTPTLYLAAGGITDTCLVGSNSESRQDNTSGWVVVGCGTELNEGCCNILSADQLGKILFRPDPPLQHLDGHYIAIQWQRGRVVCYSDKFGLRTLYMAKANDGVAFSTRIDWVSKIKGSGEIDFEQFGSHWLTFNQFSYGSLVKGITRLEPNGVAVCTSESITTKSQPWSPDLSLKSQRPMRLIIQSFLNPKPDKNRTLSFGLSGGLDSRALLALLISDQRQPFVLHLCGHLDDPDVRIARKIAAAEELQQVFYNDPIPSPDQSINMLREYVTQSTLVAPSSTMLKLRYYPSIHAQQRILIDGGLGEIARRQYLNRLLLLGRHALRRKKPELIYRHIAIGKPAIFAQQVSAIMQKGIERQLEGLWNTMPTVKDIGAENFADLLSVRYRFPNWGGMEQARMDGQIMIYMPFAQPSCVSYVFAASLRIRRNGHLFRCFINQHRPSLSKYPLVKGNTSFPYTLPTVPTWLYIKAKAKIGRQFVDPTPSDFLFSISEFVLDTLHSSKVKSYASYDHRTIVAMVEQFYSGRSELVREVDWWLAFEIWRQSLESS